MEKSSYTMKKSNGWSTQLVSISGKLNVLAFGVISQDMWIKVSSIWTFCIIFAPKVWIRAKSVDGFSIVVAILYQKFTCESHEQYEFLQINTLY